MKKLFVCLLALVAAAQAFANDLVLANERYGTVFAKYICSDWNENAPIPADFAAHGIVFEKLTGDQALSNFLVTANYKAANGAACRYNVILGRDRAGKFVTGTASKAYAVAGAADCTAGKALLDATFSTRIGYAMEPVHPHRFLSIQIPARNSACGNQAIHAVFQLQRRR